MFSRHCDCDNRYHYEYNTAGRRNENRNFLGEYFSHFLRGMFSPLETSFHEKKKDFHRMVAAKFIGAIGWLFLLNGLAILVNNILGIGRWGGYLLIGLILILFSLAKRR